MAFDLGYGAGDWKIQNRQDELILQLPCSMKEAANWRPKPPPSWSIQMAFPERLRQRSTLTGVAAILFTGGVVLLFVALYKDATHWGGSPLWIVALGVLAAAVLCWFAAAYWGENQQGLP